MVHRPMLAAFCLSLTLNATLSAGDGEAAYTLRNLGKPAGAANALGVRMNNHGHVAGFSYFTSAPTLRGWIWTPEDGFTILPAPPPGFNVHRAMDINDAGVVAGDGGFDSGLAFRYVDGVYDVTGSVDGLPIAYLGGLNELGDLAGTAKDNQLITPDRAFLDIANGELINVTPAFGGQGTDVNNERTVIGYTDSLEAFRWTQDAGVELLGTLDLARSFAWRINEAGEIVGHALSANGNTQRAFLYTPGVGMIQVPGTPVSGSSVAVSINNAGDIIGSVSGSPAQSWRWTPDDGLVFLFDLYDVAASDFNVLEARDINDGGQILAQGFDSANFEYRTVILTPPAPSCDTDLDGDGATDASDLAALLAVWGSCRDCDADLDLDGEVGPADLALLLGQWGACPE